MSWLGSPQFFRAFPELPLQLPQIRQNTSKLLGFGSVLRETILVFSGVPNGCGRLVHGRTGFPCIREIVAVS